MARNCCRRGSVVDIDNYTVTYYLSTGTEKTVDITDNDWPSYKPEIYGDDAYYVDAQLENKSFILLIKKDMTKLYICDNNDNLMENGEFTASETTEPEPEIKEPVFEGNCAINTKTVVKFLVDIEEKKVTYYLSGETEGVNTSVQGDYSKQTWKPQDYGADAYYWEIKIEGKVYNLLIAADKSKLCIYDSDNDEPLDSGEFVVGVAA